MLGITRKQAMTLAVLISGTFIAILNQTILGPALPTIMRDMQVSAATVQWLTTGFTLVNAVMIPISAYLTDRFSVKTLFIAAMGVFTAGTLAAGLSTAFPVLLAARLLQAAGAGVLMPMVMTVLLLTFPVERRGMAMGVFSVIIAFAPTIGPVVAGVVVDHAGWNIIFLAVAVLGAVDVVLAAFFLERGEGGDPTVKGVDKLSVLLSTFGFGGMLYGFSEVGNSGLSPLAAASMIGGSIIVVLFFIRQNRLERPMLRVDVLKNRKFLIGTIICMVSQGATMANMVIIPIYVQTIMGQTATTAALVMLPGSIIMGVMGPVAGRIFDKRGPRGLAIAGLGTLLAGTLIMTQLTLETTMVFVAIVMAVRLLGMSMVNMPVTTWGINALDNKVVNHGNAVNNTLRQVAGSLGTAIVISAYALWTALCQQTMGTVEAQIAGTNFSFGLQAVLIAAALAIAVIAVRDRVEDAAQEDPHGERRRTLESIMTHDFLTLPASSTVADAARLFAERRVDGMPLIDEDGKPAGYVSDGDLMRALSPRRDGTAVDFYAVADGGNRIDPDVERWIGRIMELPVTSIASNRLVGIDAHATVHDMYRILSENSMRRVPVLDNGKICGIIDRSDVTAYALEFYLNRPNKEPDSGAAQRAAS